VALAAAPVPEKSRTAREESPAQKLRRELEVVVTADLAEQELAQAVDQLRVQTGVNVVLDRSAFTALGLEPAEVKVSLKARQVKLKNVLRGLTHQCGLSFAVVGDSALISTEDMVLARQLRQPVSVSLEKVPCAEALKRLAKETATNLVMDPRAGKEAQAPVSLELDEVTLEAAVRLLAEMAGLKAVRVGNVLFVTSKATATSMRADPELVPRVIHTEGLAVPGAVPMIVPGGPAGGGGRAVPPIVPPGG